MKTRAELILQVALMSDEELNKCIQSYLGNTDLNGLVKELDKVPELKKGGTIEKPVDVTEEYKDILEREWPALVGLNYHVIEDPNFAASSVGYGSIETMIGENAEYRDDEGNVLYTYENPYPGDATIVLNPNEVVNKKSAVKLDLLHVLRAMDPTYNDLLNEVQFDVNDDLYQLLMLDIKEGKTGGLDADYYIANGIDGFLRNQFVEGTPEEILAMNYNPNKQEELYYNPGISKGISKIYQYLTSHKIGEVEVTPKEVIIHKNGGSLLDLLKDLLPESEIFDLIKEFGIDDLMSGGLKKGTSVSISITIDESDSGHKIPEVKTIEVGNSTYEVEVVSSMEDMEKGLSGRKTLDSDKGMLFDFGLVEDEITFNMEDMLFNLDIVFINDDDEVIRVAENCSPGADLFTESNVRYVLEVNANSGIKSGDEVDLDPKESNSLVMKVLAPDGSTQMELLGGERIFSRKNTKTLIKMAKRAENTKSDTDYKKLGNKMFKFIHILDTNTPEYVEVPED